VSIIEPSDAVKRRNGYQTGGRRLAQVSAPPVNTLAWLGSRYCRKGVTVDNTSRKVQQKEETSGCPATMPRDPGTSPLSRASSKRLSIPLPHQPRADRLVTQPRSPASPRTANRTVPPSTRTVHRAAALLTHCRAVTRHGSQQASILITTIKQLPQLLFTV
jgi:hypothetical protein